MSHTNDFWWWGKSNPAPFDKLRTGRPKTKSQLLLRIPLSYGFFREEVRFTRFRRRGRKSSDFAANIKEKCSSKSPMSRFACVVGGISGGISLSSLFLCPACFSSSIKN
jgi:hypothetical protein